MAAAAGTAAVVGTAAAGITVAAAGAPRSASASWAARSPAQQSPTRPIITATGTRITATATATRPTATGTATLPTATLPTATVTAISRKWADRGGAASAGPPRSQKAGTATSPAFLSHPSSASSSSIDVSNMGPGSLSGPINSVGILFK